MTTAASQWSEGNGSSPPPAERTSASLACAWRSPACIYTHAIQTQREQGATRQLAVTRVERDDALLDVMEPQLLDFYAEAKEDDEPFPIDSIEAAQLRSALRDARAERVGEERVYGGCRLSVCIH